MAVLWSYRPIAQPLETKYWIKHQIGLILRPKCFSSSKTSEPPKLKQVYPIEQEKIDFKSHNFYTVKLAQPCTPSTAIFILREPPTNNMSSSQFWVADSEPHIIFLKFDLHHTEFWDLKFSSQFVVKQTHLRRTGTQSLFKHLSTRDAPLMFIPSIY